MERVDSVHRTHPTPIGHMETCGNALSMRNLKSIHVRTKYLLCRGPRGSAPGEGGSAGVLATTPATERVTAPCLDLPAFSTTLLALVMSECCHH